MEELFSKQLGNMGTIGLFLAACIMVIRFLSNRNEKLYNVQYADFKDREKEYKGKMEVMATEIKELNFQFIEHLESSEKEHIRIIDNTANVIQQNTLIYERLLALLADQFHCKKNNEK